MDSIAENQIWSIYQLTVYIKERLESDPALHEVWVRGEISNFKHHSRGHMYFTLKDASSRVLSVMFQGYNRFLRFIPKDGMKVIVRGEISLFERDGQYQLYIKEMQPDGLGSLYLAFEQLKSRLDEEGLFDPVLKKPLPKFPQKIAVITSPTGAAIRDILTTIKRRYPYVHLFIIPVAVQGELAPSSIIQGLRLANQKRDVDLIILGRGGGSIEELWAFNDEGVARAIFGSQIPIISAVGHETDFTIADFVADVRAATPTAAAEMAVPHYRELHDQLFHYKHRLQQALSRKLIVKRQQLESLNRATVLRKPFSRIKQAEQQLDILSDSLKRFVKQYPTLRRTTLQYLERRLYQVGIPARIKKEQQNVKQIRKNLDFNLQKQIEKKRLHTSYLINQLDALSPLSIMKRGYTIAKNHEKKIVSSIRQISPSDLLYIQFKDGVAETTIWGIEEDSPYGTRGNKKDD